MALAIEHIEFYLGNIKSLLDIDNHKVAYKGSKKGQTPLTIQHIGECITRLIDYLEESYSETVEYDEDLSNENHEIELLQSMHEKLNNLPINTYNPLAIYNTLSNLETIQQEALNSIYKWLSLTTQSCVERHALYKGMTLLLKILEYDFSKPGPLTVKVGISFFSTEIELLSADKKLENLSTVKSLLAEVHSKEKAIKYTNDSTGYKL